MPLSSAIFGGTAAVRKSSLNRLILALAGPAIIANITTPLLSMVDVAIAGHLGSAVYVAAIAVGGTMFNLIYWLFGFLRMGTSGLTAQAHGRNLAEAGPVLSRSLMLAMAFAAAILLLQQPLCRLLLSFIDADAETAAIAATYFRILVWGAPASFGLFALTGWLVGMQDTRANMLVSLLVNVVNIAVSLILTSAFHLKIHGIATGTLVAQWTGFLAAVIYVCRRYRFRPSPLKVIANRADLAGFFRVNTDIFLRTLCLIAVTLWFTRAGASQGEVVLAANAVLMQFFTFFSYMMDGFATAGEALCGEAYGAGDRARMQSVVRALMRIGGCVALLFSLIYFAGGDAIIRLLTSDVSIRSAASDFSLWAVTIPLAGFMAFTWDGVFIGATMTRQMLLSIAGATAVYFTIWFSLSTSLGNHALWLAFTAYLLTRGLLQCLLYRITSRAAG